ncbi:hypothetical protein BJ170DRAFT_592425 [Xylariales sp. AK1849]|nr:hypothetical protein BJ170DRAFT_592425 [Xylariales sp. AK1849]
MPLARRLGFAFIRQRATGLSIHQNADGSDIFLPFGSRPQGNPGDAAILEDFINVLNGFVERSRLEDPSLGPDAMYQDSVALKEHAKESFGDVAMNLCNSLAYRFLIVEAEDLSALYIVDHIKSGTRLPTMSSDREHEVYCIFPPPVIMRTRPEDRLCSVKTATVSPFWCKKAIVSLYTCLLPTITFNPPLPAAEQAPVGLRCAQSGDDVGIDDLFRSFYRYRNCFRMEGPHGRRRRVWDERRK